MEEKKLLYFAPEEEILPVMTLREVVMFPKAIVPLFVGREKSMKAIDAALADFDKRIFLVTQKDPEIEDPDKDDLYEVGCVSRILQVFKLPDGTNKVLFEGIYRARLDKATLLQGDYFRARVTSYPDSDYDKSEAEALIRLVQESLEEFAQLNPKMAKESLLSLSSLKDPAFLADGILPHLNVKFPEKQEVLELANPLQRLEKVYGYLQGEIEIYSLEQRIKNRVKKQMEKNQREYYLSEQLKAIHKEMGRDVDPKAELDKLEEKIEAKNMPEEAKKRALEELKKLKITPTNSAEYTVSYNYIDWILALPWNELKDTDIDLEDAARILDEDHYGLEKPKERILEYLAVQKLAGKVKGPILCLVGPPGVGKTSLAKSVARAMQREFVRLSLGGVRDEAEIRGHRRTYVGALPGKIIQSLKKVQYNNPVFCLDEVDKMSADFRGDPAAALLEVLDPEQNYAFNDHYLDLDYDLSNIFFITTANSLHTIPLPLQDRMEIIKLPGYLETEKKKIARYFLLPKQLKATGLEESRLRISDGAIEEIIRHYTREAGVRNLEREIASICRKVAKKLVSEKETREITISKNNLGSYLGVPKVKRSDREEQPLVGVTVGLAWTELGGEILLVEATIMPGSGKLEITGKLGEVMQESARAALSYVRSRSEVFGLKPDFYKEIDVHIHVPEAATPKDGPSAGITLTTSLISALLNLPVRNDLAMTGEITLRGRVLPIGGLREKLLAAKRSEIKEVLIPWDNQKDLEEVPQEVLKGLEITPVKHMDEVLPLALVGADKESLFCGTNNCLSLTQKLLKEEFRSSTQQ
ncbi:MAG: ATP-dependent Lon protease [Desulfonauticus sp.]|jgi:ATP-dependent Lon protease|nr:MAG: Lon protease [Desulfonauticus sp. 38_4375]MDK2920892.1 ATP-dependent Lon protease [Desulfonauticus sp.]